MSSDTELLRVVNSSGFPLQIAIQNAIEKMHSEWRVAHREHAWRNSEDGTCGFIDIVLQHRTNSDSLVIECKRSHNTQWLFLSHSDSNKHWHQTKVWATYYVGTELKHFGWVDLSVTPATAEAQFCCVRGQTPNSGNTQLERIASELVSSTEALAIEERNYHITNSGHPRLYFNVIVTTAELRFVKYEASSLSVDTGTLANAEFEEVPYLRVRKQFSSRPEPFSNHQLQSMSDPDCLRESTVFVVNAAHFTDFLRDLNLLDIDFTDFRRTAQG